MALSVPLKLKFETEDKNVADHAPAELQLKSMTILMQVLSALLYIGQKI